MGLVKRYDSKSHADPTNGPGMSWLVALERGRVHNFWMCGKTIFPFSGKKDDS